MLKNPTAKQYRLLRTLREFAADKGYMPSVRELGGVLGLSAATVQQHINALRSKGWLESDGAAHGLRFTDEGLRGNGLAGEAHAPPPVPRPARVSDGEPVRVVGTIAAGRPIEALEDADADLVRWPEDTARPGDFALRVAGQSMIEDGIFDGDLVLVRPQASVANGEVAVALLDDGTATLKRVYRERGRIRLQPANSQMTPLWVDEVRIQGRVVGLLRRYA